MKKLTKEQKEIKYLKSRLKKTTAMLALVHKSYSKYVINVSTLLMKH